MCTLGEELYPLTKNKKLIKEASVSFARLTLGVQAQNDMSPPQTSRDPTQNLQSSLNIFPRSRVLSISVALSSARPARDSYVAGKNVALIGPKAPRVSYNLYIWQFLVCFVY